MTVRTIIGDCREVLKTLPSESVHCVVTSPPYWGLRDYGTVQWEGGDANCEHEADKTRDRSAEFGSSNTIWGIRDGRPTKACPSCGARRIDKQLGLEPTYQEHVAAIAALFDEVHRVLRKDGTLWLNYGDSYAGKDLPGWRPGNEAKNGGSSNKNGVGYVDGLKPKDLCGIPWRVAFALQERGWWLRQDIIWHKPNPMPESIKDRCTKAHEYIFLLSKSARYYFDAEAISEDAVRPGYTAIVTERSFGHQASGMGRAPSGNQIPGSVVTVGDTRNRRSVWTIATAPFGEAHFATFPPELPELCIKAGTSQKGCCAACGAPWVREMGRDNAMPDIAASAIDRFGDGSAGVHRKIGGAYQKALDENPKRNIGWSPSCQCNAEVIPTTILDPFGGAGTTGLVADRLQRHAIMIELNPDYAEIAGRRVSDDRGGLLDLMEAAQ